MLVFLLYVQGERGSVGYPGASGRSGMKVMPGNIVHLFAAS